MDKRLLNSRNFYFTTGTLATLFEGTRAPQQKINYLAEKGDLVRIKRNLYILGPDFHRPYSKEVLAGMIYGPSAISLEYALSFHGLIPERVETVTSICFKKDKHFKTPVGEFTYRYLSKKRYPVGIELHKTELGNFFMASPEKALCDMAFYQKLESEQVAVEYCLKDLRIEPESILKLDGQVLKELSRNYKRASTTHLVDGIIIYQNQQLKK